MNVHHCGKLISRDQREKDMKCILQVLKHYNDGPHEWDEVRPCVCRVTKTTMFAEALKY